MRLDLNRLENVRISRRLLLISLAYSLPIGVLLYFVVTGINGYIAFAQAEKDGNTYLEPLEQLLDYLPQYASARLRAAQGSPQAAGDLPSLSETIDEAMAALENVDRRLGAKLQFTSDGLAKRNRQHACVATLKREWRELKDQAQTAAPEAVAAQCAHLVADVRTMITHAGDTSNLILDPDLDSYYLMDVTLLALPQMQDRLAVVGAFGEAILKQRSITEKERLDLNVYCAFLKEADLDRVVASAQTALNEDLNFYGRSESLQRNVPPALQELNAATEQFIALNRRLAASATNDMAVPEYQAVVAKARAASFRLWRVAVQELDALLDARIGHFKRQRLLALSLGGCSLLIATAFVALVIRGINKTLKHIAAILSSAEAEVGGAVGLLNAGGRTFADNAGQQAASLEQTSASLEEIATVTKRSAEDAQTGKQLANEARATAENGSTAMQEMSQAMKAIASSSDNIVKIVKSIDEIAFQTNILALNAAVEAARAGDAGVGFAVVADEVRALAQRSAAAARETAERIEDSIKNSGRGVQISARVAESFEQIVAKTRQVDELIAQIAAASGEQSLGLEQINGAMAQMQNATQSTAAESEQNAALSEELSTHALTLQRAVEALLKQVGSTGRSGPSEIGGRSRSHLREEDWGLKEIGAAPSRLKSSSGGNALTPLQKEETVSTGAAAFTKQRSSRGQLSNV